MSKQIKDLNIMIVEDESKNIEILERILVNEEITNIHTASTTVQALELLDKAEYPDLILLDLKIPYTSGGIEDSINSVQIILEVERLNRVFDHHIRVIIISGTTQERGLQRLIARDKSLIQYMFDKGLMGKNPSAFKEELIGQIKNILNHSIKKEKPSISVLDSHRNTLTYLKSSDQILFDYLISNVFKPFEKINGDAESTVAQAIIIRCGMVVEDLIDQLNLDLSAIKGRKLSSFDGLKELIAAPSEDEKSVGNKLMRLSGRRWSKDGYEVIETGKISRQACEYAHLAYKHRNHASHKGKSDTKNDNIFKDNNFTKEHAAISISLIMPIIQDYIKHKVKN